MTISSRCFMYGRHSTKHQHMTRHKQEWACRNYYSTYLEPIGVEMVPRYFYDEAVSGGLPFGERPEGRVVLTSVQPGDWLLFSDWSRTFRDLEDSEKVTKNLLGRRVNLHCTGFPIDTAKAVGRYSRRIIVASNQLERELAAERVVELNRYKIAEGIPHSRGCPMGWKKVSRVVSGRTVREYRVDPDERQLCGYVAGLRASGESHERIAQWLHTQRMFRSKRGSDRTVVVWMLQAHALDPPFPKITSYKRVREMIKSGELRLRTS